MIIPSQPQSQQLVLDLSGPEGNAFVILGHAKKLARVCGLDPAPILEDMMSSDYTHLIRTFDRHFGHCVTLIEPPGGLGWAQTSSACQVKVKVQAWGVGKFPALSA